MHGPSSFLFTAAVCLLQLYTNVASAAAADPPAVPTSPSCQGECADNFKLGWEFDYSNWVAANLSLDPFWDLPANLSSARPGDILSWEDLDAATASTNWTIPSGAALSRFQYATEDVDGQTIAASAFLLLPYAPRHGTKKLPTLAWAHGTSGIAGICAPTNHKNLFYDWSAPYAFVQRGYAVVAPDYAGMGSSTPRGFQYCAGWTHAADMAFSVAAARQRLGHLLSDEWVAVGQSEGGMTAWRVNQRLAAPGQEALLLRAGPFLGSVAIAPANRAIDIAEALWDVPLEGGIHQIPAYLLLNIAGLYPGRLRLEDYLTEAALGRLDLIRESCLHGGTSAVSHITSDEFYRNVSWTRDPAVVDWRETYNRENLTALAAPLLVVQGTADVLVPPSHSEEDYNRTCAAHPEARVTYLAYEGHHHDTITTSAQVDYMGWVDDLFNGKEMVPGCSRTDIRPLTARFQTAAIPYKAEE